MQRKEGAFYQVSTWALAWADENYYLVAYDYEAGKVKHYRVDKMLKINLTDVKREGSVKVLWILQIKLRKS